MRRISGAPCITEILPHWHTGAPGGQLQITDGLESLAHPAEREELVGLGKAMEAEAAAAKKAAQAAQVALADANEQRDKQAEHLERVEVR